MPRIDIAVIRFPRLSNFTDFQVFESRNGVSVRYVERLTDLGAPDLILLPGTKNTMEDLLWFRQSGLEAAVLKAAAADVPVWGICGGYQMMGAELIDEDGFESGKRGSRLAGMGLFPMATHFREEKTRTRVSGCFQKLDGLFAGLSGMRIDGYEIHMGETGNDSGEREALLALQEYQERQGQPEQERSKQDGAFGKNCYGTYVHGIFDAPGIVETMIHELLEKKGLSPFQMGEGTWDFAAYREQQYDKLADTLRRHLDLEQIYRILEEGEGDVL